MLNLSIALKDRLKQMILLKSVSKETNALLAQAK